MDKIQVRVCLYLTLLFITSLHLTSNFVVGIRNVGSYDTPGVASAIVVKDDYAYVADGTSLQILNISAPTSISLVGTFNGENISSVAVSGDLAYLATGQTGLKIINVSNPPSPKLLGSISAQDAFRVAAGGKITCFIDRGSGKKAEFFIKVMNSSDPLNQNGWGSITLSGTTMLYGYDIAVEGDRIYVADGSGGLRVYNATNSSTPKSLHVNSSFDAYAVSISQSRLYVLGQEDLASSARSDRYIYIFDISTETAPRFLKRVAISLSSGRNIDTIGEICYVGGSNTVHIFNVSDSANPVPIFSEGYTSSESFLIDIASNGEYAFAASGKVGLNIIIMEPNIPGLFDPETGSVIFLSVIGISTVALVVISIILGKRYRYREELEIDQLRKSQEYEEFKIIAQPVKNLGMGTVILFLVVEWLLVIPFSAILINNNPILSFVTGAVMIAAFVLISVKRVRISRAFKKFEVRMDVTKQILKNVVQQSLTQSRTDVRKLCNDRNFPFKDLLKGLENMESSTFYSNGTLDLESGIYYSNIVTPEYVKLNQNTDLFKKLSAEGYLDLTLMARESNMPFEDLQLMLYRYCGMNMISGRTSRTPEGNYLVYPEDNFKAEFITNLDSFINTAIIAEKTGKGKKVGGKI